MGRSGVCPKMCKREVSLPLVLNTLALTIEIGRCCKRLNIKDIYRASSATNQVVGSSNPSGRAILVGPLFDDHLVKSQTNEEPMNSGQGFSEVEPWPARFIETR